MFALLRFVSPKKPQVPFKPIGNKKGVDGRVHLQKPENQFRLCLQQLLGRKRCKQPNQKRSPRLAV
jgi:hypothetical protein